MGRREDEGRVEGRGVWGEEGGEKSEAEDTFIHPRSQSCLPILISCIAWQSNDHNRWYVVLLCISDSSSPLSSRSYYLFFVFCFSSFLLSPLLFSYLCLELPDEFRGHQAIHDGHLGVHEDEGVVALLSFRLSPLVLFVFVQALLAVAGDVD